MAVPLYEDSKISLTHMYKTVILAALKKVTNPVMNNSKNYTNINPLILKWANMNKTIAKQINK